MEPFYFGKEPRLLFGIYHPPSAPRDLNVGIVLCYPVFNEYIRSHRAFVKLAHLLSQAGFHVFRFDYYGCGDSYGESEDATISQWLTDITSAISELKDGTGVSKICMVGLRLGATLALLATSGLPHVETFLLWDPIINGGLYLEELHNSHAKKMQGYLSKISPKIIPENGLEIHGFFVPDALIKEMQSVDLLTRPLQGTEKIFLISTDQEKKWDDFCLKAKESGADVVKQFVSNPPVWVEADSEIYGGLMPTKVLETIVSCLTKTFP